MPGRFPVNGLKNLRVREPVEGGAVQDFGRRRRKNVVVRANLLRAMSGEKISLSK